MPLGDGEIESEHPDAASHPDRKHQRPRLQYADIAIVILGTLGLAWLADQLGGRRGFGGATLVSAVGAGCGAFLAVRVFAVAMLGDWPWVAWSLIGAALSLTAYYLFRSKR